MDQVFLQNLNVKTYIGVFAWEQRIQQELILDIKIDWPNHLSAKNDDLTLALDYSQVADLVLIFCENNQFELIETLAESLCELLRAQFSFSAIELKITKPGAIPEAEVGISISRKYT